MANSEFKVNTGPALAGLKDLITQIRQAGSNLDKLGATAEKTMTSASKSFEKQTQSLEKQINVSNNLGRQNKATAATLDDMARSAKDSFAVLSQNFQTAAHTARVFQKGQEELRALLLKTDHYNEIVRHHRTMAIMQEKSGNKARELAHAVDLLTTAEGKGLAQAKVYNSESQKRASAEARQTEQLKTKQQTLQLLNSEEGRANVALSERIRSEKAIIASAERLKTQERELLAQKKLNTSEDHRKVQALKATIAAQKLQDQAAQKATLATEKQKIATADLRRELQFLNSKEGKAQVRLRQQVADTRREIARSAKTQEEKNKKVRIGNQLTTALRAGLHGAQTSIGMYTSSTIAAAIATFSLARAIRSTMTVGIEFTATMARTNAIMGTSEAMFSTLSSQVRLLGQTTQFTASQVAEATTELGQAGLSAGQSIIALQPALDLAAIGNITMAKSADHATNIMTAFGKEAEDLTGVVDLLATATTSSNTTIDQLANALSYAGPAANSAGYAIEDTVAAVSTLANSGIKSSKAGTALRRLFVSLVNPTEKGAAVLSKYNIAVQDLDGSFLSLQNVINQFDAAFEGKENERLAAIQDLVGVYATSPIAALLENTGEFNAQIAQFETMGNAAERMKKKINDSLSFDVKEVKSAFQELQLKVFEDNEMQFRVWAQSITESLQYLASAGESGKTVLEELGNTVKWAAYMFGGFYAVLRAPDAFAWFAKGATAVRSSLAQSAHHASRLGTVLKATAASRSLETMAIGAAALRTNLGGASAAATAITFKGALRGAARFLGPLGMAVSTGYLLYEVYQSVFGDHSEVMKGMENATELTESQNKALSAQETRVAALKEEYDKMIRASDRRKDVRTEVNITAQQAALTKEIQNTANQMQLVKELMSDLDSDDPLLKSYEARLLILENSFDSQSKTAKALHKQLVELNAPLDEQAQLIKTLGFLTEAAKNAVFGSVNERRLQDAIANTERALADLKDTAGSTSKSIKEVLEISSKFLSEKVNESASALIASQMTDAEKHAAVFKELEDSQEALAHTRDILSTPNGEMTYGGNEGANKEISNATRRVIEATEAYHEVVTAMQQSSAEFEKAYGDMEFKQLEDAEKRVILLERRARLNQELDEIKSSGDMFLSSRGTEVVKELSSVNRELESLDKSTTRSTKSAKDLYSVYENLYKQFDKVGYSADNLAQTQADLNSLLSSGRIDQIQYNMALAEAEKAHAKVALQENKRYQLLKDLSSTYLSTDNDQRVADLTRLRENTALLTEEERKLFEQRIMSSATSNITTPNLALQGASQGPFSGFINTASNVADGNRELGDAGVGIAERQRDSLLAEQLEYRRKMESEDREIRLQAEQDFANKAKSINDIAFAESQQLAQSKLQFQKQASTMMMASMAESMSSVLGMVAATGEDATAAQKVAFAAQKALAIASILIYTHMAAAKAAADPSNPTIFGSMALSTAIMAQGYASAGLVAGMAIGELAGGGSSGGGGEGNYSGAYDDGGYIPAGKFGLVGEIGPEIVNGPANVTSRKETAALLKNGGGGGSGPQQVTIAPVINIQHESSGSTDAEQDGKMMGNAVKMVVMETLQKELRPNGMLYRRQ